jgi:hypothetical protein
MFVCGKYANIIFWDLQSLITSYVSIYEQVISEFEQ